MVIFHELQEFTKKMDEKRSSSCKSVPSSDSANGKPKSEVNMPFEAREKIKIKEERKSCALLLIGGIGALVLVYFIIRLYIYFGDFIFNSTVFWLIGVVGFIGIALYILFLIISLIYVSIADAKNSGGKSILAIAVAFIVVAVVFTLMNRCT